MKNPIFFIVLLALLTMPNCFSQGMFFGATGGLLNGGEKFKTGNTTASASDTGFYIGLNSRIPLNDKFLLSPEINYGNLNDSSFGFVSARIQYYPAPKFYLQAGPQVSYIFEAVGETMKKGGLDLTSGIGYDINDNFHIQARYSFELTNRLKGNVPDDTSSKLKWLLVGIGYSF